MRPRYLIPFLALGVMPGNHAAAQAAPPCGGTYDAATMLVEPSWLRQHLHDTGLRLLAVDQPDFEQGHIAGALAVNYLDFTVQKGGLTVELPHPSDMIGQLRQLGIGPDTRVVLYGGGANPAAVFRLWYTFDAVGMADRTSVLDGGWQAWQTRRLPVDRSPPTVPAKSDAWEICENHKATAELQEVRDVSVAAGKPAQVGTQTLLVDARNFALFNGRATQDGLPFGHIPGAVSVPYAAALEPNGRLAPSDRLRRLFQVAGVKPGDRLIVYCHVGREATIVYFAARLLGYNASLYDGSWEEWATRRPPLPISPHP